MSKWVLKGLKTAVPSTAYPEKEETASGVSPGLPSSCEVSHAPSAASLCPTDALKVVKEKIEFKSSRCIHCFRCARETGEPVPWKSGYEWAEEVGASPRFDAAFLRSIHVFIVDAGDCGACLNEFSQLARPHYSLHRLGFFVTPTPRNADIFLVVGPVTDHLRLPLQKAYEAMPVPKRVVAVGACAASGGLFGPSFISAAGVSDAIPVDVVVPGCPPPPLAILHGLLRAAGRKIPAKEAEVLS